MGTPGETKRNETSDDSPHSLTTTTTTTTAARVDAARSTRKNARSIPSLGRSRRSFIRFRRKGKSIHDASSSRSSRSRARSLRNAIENVDAGWIGRVDVDDETETETETDARCA